MYARIDREKGTVSLYNNQHELIGTHPAEEGNLVSMIDELKANRELRSVINALVPSKQLSKMPYEPFLERMFPEEFGNKPIQEKPDADVVTDFLGSLVDAISEDDGECDCERCQCERGMPVEPEKPKEHLIFMSSFCPPPHLSSRFEVYHIDLDDSLFDIRERVDEAVADLRDCANTLSRGGIHNQMVKVCIMTDPLLTCRLVHRTGILEPVYMKSNGELIPLRETEFSWVP